METAVVGACRAARALEAAAFAYSTTTLCSSTASKEKEKAIAPRRSTWARMTIKSLKTKNTAGRFQPKMTPLVILLKIKIGEDLFKKAWM